jgi:branched-chain amino acid transport system substrate-binding protein
MRPSVIGKWLGAAVLTAALCLTMATAGMAANVIKMGVVGPHSGDLAPYGIPSLQAAQLVVKDVNAKGGILGRQVKLFVEDDQCKPEIATNTATKLVSDGVNVVLGPICSGATKPVLGIYKSANIVVMSPSATNPALTQSGDAPNFFRTISSDDKQGKLAADFAINTLHLKKVAILNDKGDYGQGFAEYVRKGIEEDGKGKTKVVLYDSITPGAFDYSAVIQKVIRSGADGLIYGGYHPEASKLVQQLRRKRSKIPFISDDGVKGDSFIKLAGRYAEGVYATGPRDLSKNPLYVKAVKEYEAAYGDKPGNFYPQAYSAAMALLNAIQKAGSTNYNAIVKALRTDYVNTPVGRIRFDKRGDAEGVGFSVYQVQHGKYVVIQ